MSERAFRFGRANHLVGIVGSPADAGQEIGMIVLNAGLVHRIGPFRLHAAMTRRLNACGYPTLRFDLSTIGDSGASSEPASRTQQVLADIADAMDLLAAQAGCTRFVLLGLCSGAANAHLAARINERVVGAVFLDGHGYRTAGYYLRHYLPRLLSPARVARLIGRKLRRSGGAGAGQGAASFGVQAPPQRQARDDIRNMLQRGLKLCFVYTGGASRYYNHPRQFHECFGRAVGNHPGISVHFLPLLDHTYILVEDREHLLDIVQEWLCKNFPVTTTQSLSLA